MDSRSPQIMLKSKNSHSFPRLPGMHLKPEECKYNVRVKYYPGEADPVQILVAQDHIFNPDKVEWEDVDSIYLPPSSPDQRAEPVSGDDAPPSERARGSRQGWLRAKRRAYDYVRSNPDLDCFLTITLDGDKIARDNYGEVIHKLSTWLDNRVRRHGLKYILCPEYHKDGQSIHFHGLANKCSLSLINSVNPHTGRPVKWKGKIVLNISDFPWGFTSAVPIDGEDAAKACAGYIFKYMSKQGSAGRIGGRYYLSGGDLLRPVYLYARWDYDLYEGYEIAVPGADGALKVIQGDQLRQLIAGEGGEIHVPKKTGP